MEIAAEIIPKVSSNLGQSLSRGKAATAPVVVPKILCSLNAHRILTTATPFCSLLPPLAALANVPLCTREPCPVGDGGAGGHIGPPLRGHRNSQQRQTGRDRARPLQKDGESAEGWGDERTQGRFDIYRAVIGLVSRKAECPE